MKKLKKLMIIFTVLFAVGCSSTQILISSSRYHSPVSHSKILAVGVIKDDNDTLRRSIEKNITLELQKTGYSAVSALEEFGAGGLANLGQENTYLKLCSEGIDAVIVVTIVDNNKENQFSSHKSHTYPDNYFYDRIWNYRNIQADLAGENRGEHGNYFWEAILFNLNTLEAECTIQSRAFTSITNERILPFEKQLINILLKEKILKKQDVSRLKPF
jgi:hypothetical protein